MELIYPSEEYLNSYKQAYDEYQKNNVTTYSLRNPYESDLIEYHKDMMLGNNLPSGYVPQTTYWLVDNGVWIGQIGIRPTINENLLKRGGHIGYGIRYTEWNKGYGTKMLSLALEKSKDLGLNRVLITCNDDNIGSIRVIEKNGGRLENILDLHIDGQDYRTRRYWIEIK